MRFIKTGIPSTRSSAPFCIFLILFGMVFAGFGGYFIYGNIKTIWRGTKLEGVVVKMEMRRSSDGSTYVPIVEFVYQGRTFRKEAKISAGYRAFKTGERIFIYYDPGSPGKILIHGQFRIWGFGSIFLLTGLGVSSFGIFTWLKFNRLRYIFEHGKKYPGKILSIIEKGGVRRNDLGQLKNTFKVEFEWYPPGSGKIVASKKNVFLPVFPQPHQAGDDLLIFADPRNPKNFALDPGRSFPPTSRAQKTDPSILEEESFERNRIKNFSPQSQTSAPGWISVFFGLPFAGAGAFVVMIGTGVVEVDPPSLHPPYWTLTAIGSMFAVAGTFLIGNGFASVIAKRRVNERKRMNPSQPWFWDYQWDPNGFSENKGKQVLRLFIAIGFFAAFMAPFNWWAFFLKNSPVMIKIIAGIFDAVILLGAGIAFYKLFQFLKYGNSRISFASFPYFLGDSMALTLEGMPDRLDKIQINLRYVEEAYETSGTGNNRSARVVGYELFGKERILSGREIVSPKMFSMNWTLPENQAMVTRLSSRPLRYWQLEVKADTPGIDYHSRFLLPVYAKP